MNNTELKFKSGFVQGDIIAEHVNQHFYAGSTPRYINVINGIDGKKYTVGDNGDRCERTIVGDSLKLGKASKGKLSLADVKSHFVNKNAEIPSS